MLYWRMRYTVTTEKRGGIPGMPGTRGPNNEEPDPEIIYDGENGVEAQAQYLRQLMWNRPALIFLDGKLIGGNHEI